MTRFIVLLCSFILLTACQEQSISTKSPESTSPPATTLSKKEVSLISEDNLKHSTKAVYFVSAGGGEIDSVDLQQHPEVKVVHKFSELKEESSEGNAIWIDKNIADQVDHEWLRELPQRSNPIVLVGYHNSLYAFRETLDAFDISGPQVDWSSVRVTPGFSVWKWKEFTPSTKSAWMGGYDQSSTVDHILAITDPLLEGKIPPVEVPSFDKQQAVDAVLTDHPDYPRIGETKDIETMTGGDAPGSKVTGTLTTTVNASSEPETYIVTLTKRWNLTFNDKKLVGYWKYKVTPQAVQLIESDDNTDLVQLVK
jgi:hypothetical protein